MDETTAFHEGDPPRQNSRYRSGWHVGPVYTLHGEQKALVAFKHTNMAVVWLDCSHVLRALDRLTDAKPSGIPEMEVPWYDLGAGWFVLEACGCGSPECGSTMGNVSIQNGELYIGLVADARGGLFHLTPAQYAYPFPIRMPLRRFYAEYTETVRLLDALGKRATREADDDFPSPPIDGWIVELEADGATWRSETRLAWDDKHRKSPER